MAHTVSGPALVPVWRDFLLDTDTPVSAFAKLRADGGRFAFLLESAPAGSVTQVRLHSGKRIDIGHLVRVRQPAFGFLDQTRA